MFPLWIMQVNIWTPEHIYTNNKWYKSYLMNCLCNLQQYDDSSITFDIMNTNFTQLFMLKVVLSFGMLLSLVTRYDNNSKK